MVNLFRPGEAMNLPLPDVNETTGLVSVGLSLKEFLFHVFPASFIDAMAKNEILQIVVFSLFFGVATAAIGEQGKVIITFMDAAAHVILKVTGYVMNLAPLAVFGAMTAIIAKQGVGILKTYSIFIGEFYFSLLLLWAILCVAGFIVAFVTSFYFSSDILTILIWPFEWGTGKSVQSGNNVSHANNKTRRRFMPNLHERRFWVASENRWIKLRVSANALRTIDKNGIDAVLADLRARGEKI